MVITNNLNIFNTVDLWYSIFDMESDYFDSYLELIKSTIDLKITKLNKEYKAFEESVKKGEIDQETLDRHGDWGADEVYEIDKLEELLYRSFVVSVFIFIERSLNDFCDFIFSKKPRNPLV